MTSFIDDIAARAAKSIIEKEFPVAQGEVRHFTANTAAKEQLILYNVKAGMQNVATIVAIATVALALFSIISLPVSVILLAGSLWVRYCFHDNIENSLTKQVDGERSQTLKEKIDHIARRAEVLLPEEWKAEGQSNLFGTYLFRESIPEEILFKRNASNSESRAY